MKYWMVYDTEADLYITDRAGRVIYYPCRELARSHAYNLNESQPWVKNEDGKMVPQPKRYEASDAAGVGLQIWTTPPLGVNT